MTVSKPKHLTDISGLSEETIEDIMQKAKEFKNGLQSDSCRGKHIALMFFENSTRTRFSFEMAATKLGAFIHNFETSKSSLSKGEDFFDTMNNLSAIGYDAVIVRQSAEGLIKYTVDCVKKGKSFYKNIALINAGEGTLSHPTQALLDLFTLRENLGSLEGKNVVILGDIMHSRVARSDIELFKKMNINVTCVAPSYFRDESIKGVQWEDDLDTALRKADACICLRIQKERIQGVVELADYISKYQLTVENLPSKCLLMHPGPVNKDIEVTKKLVDSQKGNIILEQAHNGVFIRMAVLDTILGGDGV